jgi:hypothetical protein
MYAAFKKLLPGKLLLSRSDRENAEFGSQCSEERPSSERFQSFVC